jgi:hypothetical protein
MLNRFSTTGTSEYTPQHVPLPFETMGALGEKVKLEHDTADAAAAVTKTDIQGGLATQEHAKALNAKKNALLAEAQARAEQTQNYGRLTQDIKEIASSVQNDPLYQGIQRDILKTKEANTLRTDPNFQYTVQGFADEKGNVIQLGVDQPFDESYYNVVAPGNTNKEYTPLFEQIKPILTKAYEDPVTKIYTDANNNTHTEILQEGVEAEGLKRERVKQTLAEYIKNDRNALNQPSRFYSDALSKKQRGTNLTTDEHLDEIANSWLGEYYNQKDIQKFSEKITPAKKGSTTDGGGGTEGEGIPNAYTGMLDAPIVTDENLDGLYRKNEDGTHTVPLQGSIMNFAKTSNINPEENKIMTLGQTLSKLKSKFTFTFNNVDDAKEVLQKQNPKFKYDAGGAGYGYMTEDGKKGVLITTFSGINYTKEELAQTGVKSLDEISNNLLKSSSDYSFLKESAKTDGIDIESPKFQETYKKGLGKYTEEINAELGNILEIGGEAKFVVDQENNRINVDGKPFITGKAIMTKVQLNAAFKQIGKDNKDSNMPSPLMDEWEEIYLDPDGSGYGLIKPYGTDKDGNQLYAIDIKKEIPVSRAINKTYNKNVYTSEYTKNANNLDKSFDEFAGNNFRRKEQEVYESVYTNNKKSFDENLNKQLEANNQYKPQLTTILNEINAEKDPNKKKEKIINFSLILKQGGAEDIIKSYTEASQPATEGKSQGGWSPTPATPLQK